MKLCVIAVLAVGIMAGASAAQGADIQGGSCIDVITQNYGPKCIDGYQWIVRYERDGCFVYEIPVAQKFAIWPTVNGKPKMTVPVPCAELEPVPVP